MLESGESSRTEVMFVTKRLVDILDRTMYSVNSKISINDLEELNQPALC